MSTATGHAGQSVFIANRHRSDNDSIDCLVTGNECFVYADTGPRELSEQWRSENCLLSVSYPDNPQFAPLTYNMHLPDSKFSSN